MWVLYLVLFLISYVGEKWKGGQIGKFIRLENWWHHDKTDCILLRTQDISRTGKGIGQSWYPQRKKGIFQRTWAYIYFEAEHLPLVEVQKGQGYLWEPLPEVDVDDMGFCENSLQNWYAKVLYRVGRWVAMYIIWQSLGKEGLAKETLLHIVSGSICQFKDNWALNGKGTNSCTDVSVG